MFRELLSRKLRGVADLTGAQLAALEAHYELLVRWSRKLNLTSIQTLAEAVERHYCESVFLAVHLPPGPLRAADIGSGAGFPGIPVAVMRPDWEIVLIESHHRKAVFLREASRGIRNVRILATRAEEVKERFDRAVSRAVSYQDLAGILRYIAPAVDLLTGEEDPPQALGYQWKEPVRLPWGRHRFLRSGVLVAEDVSRETIPRET